MFGYAKGSVADRMTNEQRKAWKKWLTERGGDNAVFEAQLANRRAPRTRSIREV
jgi:hypothetical protein